MKKLYITIFISAIFLLGAGCTLKRSATDNVNAPALNVDVSAITPVTYLTSDEDPNKYCNGGDMDSEGFRKTITVEKELAASATGLSQEALAKEIILAATDGMCQTALQQTDLKISSGTAKVAPIDGWAGYTITMCSCKPVVEVNLLRLPGIQLVIWE